MSQSAPLIICWKLLITLAQRLRPRKEMTPRTGRVVTSSGKHVENEERANEVVSQKQERNDASAAKTSRKMCKKGQSLHSFEWYKPRNIGEICIQVKCIYKPYVSSSLNMHSILKYVFVTAPSLSSTLCHGPLPIVNIGTEELTFEPHST